MPLPTSTTLSSATLVPVNRIVADAFAMPVQWSFPQKHWFPQPDPEFHVPAYWTWFWPVPTSVSLITEVVAPGSPEGRVWVAPAASGLPRFGVPSAFQLIFCTRVVRN